MTYKPCESYATTISNNIKMPESSEEDLQIEVSSNAETDLFAVMVTRDDKRVESVVCISRGRSVVRPESRPDPERFKSPIKDGRRSALGNRNVEGVRILPDCDGDVQGKNPRPPPRRQRFHIRVANGFTRRNYGCSQNSLGTIKI